MFKCNEIKVSIIIIPIELFFCSSYVMEQLRFESFTFSLFCEGSIMQPSPNLKRALCFKSDNIIKSEKYQYPYFVSVWVVV